MASVEDRVSALEDAVAALAANAAAKSGHAGDVESAAVGLLGPDEAVEDFDIEAEYGGEEADETDVEPVEVEVADAPSTEDDGA